MKTTQPDDPTRLARLDFLARVGLTFALAPDLATLCDTVYRELGTVLDTTGFILALYDEASQTVRVVKQVENGVDLPGGSFPLGDRFTSRVIRTGEPSLIRQWSRDGPRVQVQFATDQPGLPESGVTVPLRTGKKVLGALSLQSYRAEAYDEHDLASLRVLAGQIAAAIERMQLKRGLNAELQQRLSELETVIAQLSDGLLRVDAVGRVVSLNRAARNLLCLGDGSVILGQPLDEERWGQWPLPSRTMAEALAPAVQALRRGEAFEETAVEVVGERRLVLNFKSTPLRDANDTLYGGIIVFRDVTGRREVERLKDEVLSIASHDLKTPLTVISMQAQLLLRQLAKGNATPEILETGLRGVLEHTGRLVKMLNALMDLTRIEAGRFDIECSPMDLSEVISGMVDGVRSTSAQHEFVVSATGTADGVWDEARLAQVVQNLLTNAVKYSPDGGLISIDMFGTDSEVTVRVSDRGVGLPRGELENVFRQFYRAENALSLEGSGLGLYICQGIVAAHGGRIWAESDGPGSGSTFAFQIPRQPLGAQTTPAAREIDLTDSVAHYTV